MPNQLSAMVEQRIVAFALGHPDLGPRHGSRGPVWQITAIDTYSSFAWADLVICPPAGPTVEQTSALARRIAAELQAAGWQLERVLTDNGNEFGRQAFSARLPHGTRHSQIRAGRPQTNGHVERLHRTILEKCWRPAFARFLQVRYSGLRRELAHYLHEYNFDRDHHGRKRPGAARPTSSTVPTRSSPDQPHPSAYLGVRSD